MVYVEEHMEDNIWEDINVDGVEVNFETKRPS
jgi:hypothetical protein